MPLNLYLLAYPSENLYTQRIEGRLMTCYNQSPTNQHECGLNRCSVIETDPRQASHDVLGLLIPVIRPYFFQRCLVLSYSPFEKLEPSRGQGNVGGPGERNGKNYSQYIIIIIIIIIITDIIRQLLFCSFILKDIWIDQGNKSKLCGTISKTDNRKTDRDCGQSHAYLCEKPVPGVISLWWHTSI